MIDEQYIRTAICTALKGLRREVRIEPKVFDWHDAKERIERMTNKAQRSMFEYLSDNYKEYTNLIHTHELHLDDGTVSKKYWLYLMGPEELDKLIKFIMDVNVYKEK